MAIVTRNNVLNLQPGLSAPVVVHVSQGDQGYPITFHLIDGDEDYSGPYDVVASVTGTRIDGSHYGPYSCTINGNMITFNLAAAVTVYPGNSMAEITLTNLSHQVVGSANFVFMVEECTIPNGVTYTNDPSVYQAILEYVQSSQSSIINSAVSSANDYTDTQADALSERISNLVVEAGGSDITEVVDARVNFGGIAQTALKNRLDLFLEYDVVETTSEVTYG